MPGTRRPRFGEPGYTPSSPFIAAVRAIVDGWRGCTPLHPRPARGGSSDTQEASGVPSGYVSADGFGSPEDEVGRPAGFWWVQRHAHSHGMGMPCMGPVLCWA